MTPVHSGRRDDFEGTVRMLSTGSAAVSQAPSRDAALRAVEQHAWWRTAGRAGSGMV